MTAAELYGRIGAAKAFSSSVSNALLIQNEEEIRRLIETEYGTTDSKKKQKIQKKLSKKIARQNKMIAKKEQGSTSFLVKLASYLDIPIELIIQFIAKYIVKSLPALEVGVKMLLLTNIKRMVSCAVDPRIPDEWRREGIILNDFLIDPRLILNTSPYTKWGKYLYFGVSDDDNFYKLPRAKDMNAFLWFCKTHGKFPSPNIVSNVPMFIDQGKNTIYEKTEFTAINESGGDEIVPQYVPSSLFKLDSSAGTIFLCTDRVDDGEETTYTIIPVSDKWTGVTWYKDTSNILGKKKDTIDYEKSKPLFNIEYLRSYEKNYIYPKGNFRFRVLPKPFCTSGGFIVNLKSSSDSMENYIGTSGINEVVGDEVKDVVSTYNYKFPGIQSPLPYEARFNRYGKYDKKGKFTVNTFNYTIYSPVSYGDDDYIYYQITKGSGGENVYLRFHKKNKTFDLVHRNNSNVDEELTGSNAMLYLTECYAGKTVYEFNYDYVMSMQLFDAKSIATNMVDYLMNVLTIPSIPFQKTPKIPNDINDNDGSVRRNMEQIRIDAFVDKLVTKMIENEEYEFTDCFYSFSNEDYESMEMDVAQKLINNTLVTDNSTNSVKDVYDIIDAYDADASLNSRTETISMAILKAAEASGYDISGNGGASSSRNPITEDSETGEDFIKKIIQFLISAIVNALLTPKVIMLLQVNRMMMGMDIMPNAKYGSVESGVKEFANNYRYTVDDLLNGIHGLLKGVIREIIDNIHTELLALILERLNELIAQYMKRLGIEFAMKWVNLIKQIFGCLSFGGGGDASVGYGRYNADYLNAISSALANVDYADIDANIDEIIPNTNPC